MSNHPNKGALVMTEHGVARYRYPNEIRGHNVALISNGDFVFANETEALSSKHRPEIEAYLKEKGWVWTGTQNWVNGSSYFLHTFSNYFTVRLDGAIHPEDFDSAPSQQAEAILMARLLNATKP